MGECVEFRKSGELKECKGKRGGYILIEMEYGAGDNSKNGGITYS